MRIGELLQKHINDELKWSTVIIFLILVIILNIGISIGLGICTNNKLVDMNKNIETISKQLEIDLN